MNKHVQYDLADINDRARRAEQTVRGRDDDSSEEEEYSRAGTKAGDRYSIDDNDAATTTSTAAMNPMNLEHISADFDNVTIGSSRGQGSSLVVSSGRTLGSAYAFPTRKAPDAASTATGGVELPGFDDPWNSGANRGSTAAADSPQSSDGWQEQTRSRARRAVASLEPASSSGAATSAQGWNRNAYGNPGTRSVSGAASSTQGNGNRKFAKIRAEKPVQQEFIESDGETKPRKVKASLDWETESEDDSGDD